MFLWLVVAGCSTPAEEAEEMTFSVNPNLLGDHYTAPEHGFSITAPIGWVQLPDSLLTEAMEAMAQSDAPRPDHMPDLVAMFSHPDNGAQLIVVRYGSDLTLGDRNGLIEDQGDGLRMGFQDGEISHARFSHGGYRIDQYRLIADNLVIFKLFAHRPEIDFYQLDYVLPLTAYEAELRALESSIGSLAYQNPTP